MQCIIFYSAKISIFARMKLSVIIPVFNSRATLHRCVESVLRQDVTDMEVLLVDDGSNDGSSEACDELAKEASCLKVIHKENGGLSSARNAGIAAASGEYITFVDSDDTLVPLTYASLLAILCEHEDYDMLEYPAMIHYGDEQNQHQLCLKACEYSDMRQYWLQEKTYRHAYAWNKIYRRQLFDDVKFPEGRNFEDIATLPLLLEKCHKVATCNVGCYCYWRNEHGITATATATDYMNLLESNNKVLLRWHDKAYYAQVVNIALDVYDRTGIVPEVPNLPYAGTPKLFLKRLIGLKGLCKLHQIIRRNHS